MSDNRTQEIRERWEKVSQGPWGAPFDSYVVAAFGAETGKVCQLNGPWIVNPNCANDSQFIAHARSDVAYLLGENEKLEAVTEAAERLDSDEQEYPVQHQGHIDDGLHTDICPLCALRSALAELEEETDDD